MANTAQRIKDALNIRNMKQADLVEKTGIGKSSISTYISGDYEPKQRNLHKIAKALRVSEAWLMGYDVPMDSKLTPEEAWDKEAQKVIDRVYAFDSQLKILGWEYQIIAEGDSSNTDSPDVYALFKKDGTTFRVSGNDYDAFIDDSLTFMENRLQKLLQKSTKDLFTQSNNIFIDKSHLVPNAAHQRTDLSKDELNDNARNKHDDDIMEDPNF